MRAIASFVMGSRLQAILVAAVCSFTAIGLLAMANFLALLTLSPLLIFLGGVISLVTLRNGPVEGLLVMLAGSLAGGLVASAGFSGGMPLYVVMLVVAATAVPAWILSTVLRKTISLGVTMEISIVIGIVVVLGTYMFLGNPAELWEAQLQQAMAPVKEQAELAMSAQQIDESIKVMARHMTGMMAASVTVPALLCVFLGRWMQAMLYNPGGFKEEFYQVRLGRVLGIAAVVIVLLAGFTSGIVDQLALASSWVIGSVYLIVGMAIAHKLVAMRSNLKPMLIVLYLLLLFPYTAALASVPVAVLGWSDTWMNYRARMAAGGAPPPDEEDR